MRVELLLQELVDLAIECESGHPGLRHSSDPVYPEAPWALVELVKLGAAQWEGIVRPLSAVDGLGSCARSPFLVFGRDHVFLSGGCVMNLRVALRFHSLLVVVHN